MESPDPKRRRVTDGSWSRLPSNILLDIACKRGTSAATYAALRGVCRSWRAALPATVPRPHRLPPQLPFLLLLSRLPHDPVGPALSLATNRTFDLRHLADARRSACVGSCYGWLLLLDPGYNLVLRNPFTGDTIHLPSLPRPAMYKEKLLIDHHSVVRRVILSSDPSADRDFLVVLFTITSTSRCFTWQSGHYLWTVREHPRFFPDEIIFYKDRRCIVVGPDGKCAVFDFAVPDGGDGFFTKVPDLPVSESPFLVESAGNVWLVTVRSIIPGKEAKVEIYRLDFSRLPDEVTAVPECGDLGGRILFLEQCNSFSIASTHFPGFEGDSIYFTEINWRRRDSYKAIIWERQFKNGIVHRRSVKGECGIYCAWAKLLWVPPNLHKKLG